MVAEIANVGSIRALTTVPDNVLFSLGFNLALDGGQGTFIYNSADTTSADNGGTIIVDSAGHRWYRDTQTEDISVKWFGATGNGSTDDTYYIQEALNYVGAKGGGTVSIPAGTYKISSALNIAYGNVRVRGSSRQGTVIASSSATADTFFVSPQSGGTLNYVEITRIGISPSVTKTGGAAIHQSGAVNHSDYSDLDLYSATGIFLESNGTAAIANITDFYIGSCPTAGIYLGSSMGIIQDVFISNGDIISCGTGVLCENVAGVYCDNVDIIECSEGLSFQPGQNENVRFLYFNQVLADTSSNNGWSVAATSNGVVASVICNACWAAGSGSYGILLNTGGIVNGFTWNNGIIRDNRDSGAYIVSGANVIFSGNEVFNNASSNPGNFHGLAFGAGVGRFVVTSNISGLGGYDEIAGTGNSQGYGIYVYSGAGDHIVIQDNVLYGNRTGGVYSGATGANVVVLNNPS